MKRICALAVLALSLTACKKQDPAKETQGNPMESVDSFVSNSQSPNNLVEISPEALSDQLKLENDTLYVTNFFATWCGPCVREMPHFTEKMSALKGEKVKFTFVSVDEKSDWAQKVPEFGVEHGIAANIVLLDSEKLDPTFFSSNFKTWDGASIPFTQFKKGDKSLEVVGMMTKEHMESQFNAFESKP